MNNYTKHESTNMSSTKGVSQLHNRLDVHTDSQNLDRFCSKGIDIWLEENTLGYRELKYYERSAIFHFLLLWSLFEARVLKRDGSICEIEKATKRWAGDGLLNKEIFEPQVDYFRNRYFVNDNCTCHFRNLKLPLGYLSNLVKDGLSNLDASPYDVAIAILIIVYRIRNNLFHGEKWTYELRGQLDNFNHANVTLIKAIELNNKATEK